MTVAREARAETFSQNWTIDESVGITFTMGRELRDRLENLNEIREVALELGLPYTSLSKLRLYDIIFWVYLHDEGQQKPKSRPIPIAASPKGCSEEGTRPPPRFRSESQAEIAQMCFVPRPGSNLRTIGRSTGE
jgi:hypothetical protein